MHNLKICTSNENLEGAFGMSLVSKNIFLVANIDKVTIHDSTHFDIINSMPIKLFESTSREPN